MKFRTSKKIVTVSALFFFLVGCSRPFFVGTYYHYEEENIRTHKLELRVSNRFFLVSYLDEKETFGSWERGYTWNEEHTAKKDGVVLTYYDEMETSHQYFFEFINGTLLSETVPGWDFRK